MYDIPRRIAELHQGMGSKIGLKHILHIACDLDRFAVTLNLFEFQVHITLHVCKVVFLQNHCIQIAVLDLFSVYFERNKGLGCAVILTICSGGKLIARSMLFAKENLFT